MARRALRLVVFSSQSAPELSLLRSLPPSVEILGVGRSLAELVDDQGVDLSRADIALNCGVGENATSKDALREMWPRLTNLRWLHTCSTGQEHMLFPELVDSSVALTNARGCFSHSLAEFALFGMKYFALDMPRHVRNKTAARWEPFDVQELRGQTLGIVGFGDIGRSCARLARASGMRIAAARRDWSGRTAPCGEEPYPGLRFESVPDGLTALAEASDFVVMSTPWTPETNAMIGADFFSAMGPDGVFVNVGRGARRRAKPRRRAPLTDHHGAALDVFAEEPCPLPAPWGLENVVITPHCADRTEHFQRDAVRQFIENVERYQSGDPLNNPVDKRLGY